MTTPATPRKAFTLVEMLVVIAIIAVLAGALFPKLAQIQENGWATRCKANLKNLYQATLNYENDNGQAIPYAGSYEVEDVNGKYYERPGWVRWIPSSGTTYPDWSDGQSHAGSMSKQNGGTRQLWYGADAMLSITNGTLWDCTGNQLSAYLCPRFARSSFCGRSDARRNYVMNGFFYTVDWASWWPRNVQNRLDNKDPSRLPLFCDGDCDKVSGVLNDGVLVFDRTNKKVSGFKCVHKIAGHMRCQVVYLDGHVTATTNLSYAACNGDE